MLVSAMGGSGASKKHHGHHSKKHHRHHSEERSGHQHHRDSEEHTTHRVDPGHSGGRHGHHSHSGHREHHEHGQQGTAVDDAEVADDIEVVNISEVVLGGQCLTLGEGEVAGMALGSDGKGAFLVVLSVEEGGKAAEAGVARGMALKSIAGASARGLSLEEAHAMLDTQPRPVGLEFAPASSSDMT